MVTLRIRLAALDHPAQGRDGLAHFLHRMGAHVDPRSTLLSRWPVPSPRINRPPVNSWSRGGFIGEQVRMAQIDIGDRGAEHDSLRVLKPMRERTGERIVVRLRDEDGGKSRVLCRARPFDKPSGRAVGKYRACECDLGHDWESFRLCRRQFHQAGHVVKSRRRWSGVALQLLTGRCGRILFSYPATGAGAGPRRGRGARDPHLDSSAHSSQYLAACATASRR